MGDMDTIDAVVVGAGVVGLAIGRALALQGRDVLVLEQADAIREVGAGLQISPNGAAVLKALDLGDALEAASTRAGAVELRDGLGGGVVTRLEVAKLRPDQGYHFLQDFQLPHTQAGVADAVGGDLEHIFKQGYAPRKQGGDDPGFVAHLLEMGIPGKGHEDIAA